MDAKALVMKEASPVAYKTRRGSCWLIVLRHNVGSFYVSAWGAAVVQKFCTNRRNSSDRARRKKEGSLEIVNGFL